MPSLLDYITEIFVIVDDSLNKILQDYGQPLRERGFMPKCTDSEIITMELIGEMCGIDSTTGIWRYFKQHWSSVFPAIPSRSQFAKQCQNLWAIKQKIFESLLVTSNCSIYHIVDGFPLPICHNRRINKCKRFRDDAAKSFCASKRQFYYGFKGHLLVNQDGEVVGFDITAANVDERAMLIELMANRKGLTLGDKGYLGKEIKNTCANSGITIETPVKRNMVDKVPKDVRTLLNKQRRIIETTIGQLAQIFNIERTWARTMLSLTNRLYRKILSHRFATTYNKMHGRSILHVAELGF